MRKPLYGIPRIHAGEDVKSVIIASKVVERSNKR